MLIVLGSLPEEQLRSSLDPGELKSAIRRQMGAHRPGQVTCACGEEFTTRSTKDNLRLEICSKCHPFFTGQQKIVDTAGRVERFRKRYEGVSYGKKS